MTLEIFLESASDNDFNDFNKPVIGLPGHWGYKA